jgi:hypothetical protein
VFESFSFIVVAWWGCGLIESGGLCRGYAETDRHHDQDADHFLQSFQISWRFLAGKLTGRKLLFVMVVDHSRSWRCGKDEVLEWSNHLFAATQRERFGSCIPTAASRAFIRLLLSRGQKSTTTLRDK